MRKIVVVLLFCFAVPLIGGETPEKETSATSTEATKAYQPKAFVACYDLSRLQKENLVGCQFGGSKPKDIVWLPEGGFKSKGYGWFYYIPVSPLRPTTTEVRFVDPEDPHHRTWVHKIVGQRIGDSFACLSCDDPRPYPPQVSAASMERVASSAPHH